MNCECGSDLYQERTIVRKLAHIDTGAPYYRIGRYGNKIEFIPDSHLCLSDKFLQEGDYCTCCNSETRNINFTPSSH